MTTASEEITPECASRPRIRRPSAWNGLPKRPRVRLRSGRESDADFSNRGQFATKRAHILNRRKSQRRQVADIVLGWRILAKLGFLLETYLWAKCALFHSWNSTSASCQCVACSLSQHALFKLDSILCFCSTYFKAPFTVLCSGLGYNNVGSAVEIARELVEIADWFAVESQVWGSDSTSLKSKALDMHSRFPIPRYRTPTRPILSVSRSSSPW